MGPIPFTTDESGWTHLHTQTHIQSLSFQFKTISKKLPGLVTERATFKSADRAPVGDQATLPPKMGWATFPGSIVPNSVVQTSPKYLFLLSAQPVAGSTLQGLLAPLWQGFSTRQIPAQECSQDASPQQARVPLQGGSTELGKPSKRLYPAVCYL